MIKEKKMKSITKIIASFLIILMIAAAFASCGSEKEKAQTDTVKAAGDSNDVETEGETDGANSEDTGKDGVEASVNVVGTWLLNEKADIGDSYDSLLSGVDDEDMAKAMAYTGKFEVTSTLEFKNDGKYMLKVVPTDETREELLAAWEKTVPGYLVSAAEKEGKEVTVDEILSASGMTLDDFLEGLYSEFLDDNIRAFPIQSGRYKIDGNKLYTNIDESSDKFKDDDYDEISLVDDTLFVGKDVYTKIK